MSDSHDRYIDEVIAALGGGNTEFYLVIKNSRIALECRYQGCNWGETTGEIELWDFAVDAREHWDAAHHE
jgi:hypothetical protein